MAGNQLKYVFQGSRLNLSIILDCLTAASKGQNSQHNLSSTTAAIDILAIMKRLLKRAAVNPKFTVTNLQQCQLVFL